MANAIEIRNRDGKMTSPSIVTAMARPENVTVRPATAMVRSTASSTVRPAASSSRNRLTRIRP
jgi:hypothetical protein